MGGQHLIVIYRGPSRFKEGNIVAYLHPYAASKVGKHVLGLTVVPLNIFRPAENGDYGAADFYSMLNAHDDGPACGDCPRRPNGKKNCYVPNSRQGYGLTTVANNNRQALLLGQPRMPTLEELKKGKYTLLRSAVWGDAGALPAHVWLELEENVRAGGLDIVGYTHAWAAAPHLRMSHMASCDTQLQEATAQSLGWRTFTVVDPGQAGNLLCPSSHEWVAMGKPVVPCESCRLCTGGARPRSRNVRIWDHTKTQSHMFQEALTLWAKSRS